MPDLVVEAATEAAGESVVNGSTVEGQPDRPDQPDQLEGAEALGDPGKKALDAMKLERNQAKKDLAETRNELESMRAQSEGRAAEYEADQARRKVESDALVKANTRIVRSAVAYAAKGQLADPKDALTFLNTDEFSVGDDGEVDEAQITDALAALLNDKPYLAAQGERRFQGGADGGARNESGPRQLTRADLAQLTPTQISAAKAAGQLRELLGNP